jgi:outer membrane protein insertion porin family
MLKIYITLLYFIFFNLYADVVQKLEVQGNKRISTETIKVYGDITLGTNYSNLEINKILKNLYNTDFFEDIKISVTSGTLKIIVNEYPVINFIDLEGEKSLNIKKKILAELLQKVSRFKNVTNYYLVRK